MDEEIKLIRLVPSLMIKVMGYKSEKAVNPLLSDGLLLVRERNCEVGKDLVWSNGGIQLLPYSNHLSCKN